jgi:peptide/nickel transport system substrate-binding protein
MNRLLSRPLGRFFHVLSVVGLWTASAVFSAEAQTTDRPTRGGTMVVSLGANPDHLNLAISSSVIVALPSQAMIEGLIRLDGNFAPQPALAKSWDVGSDDKTITFHLREDVKWHDGKTFTSADVKFSMETLTKLHSRAATIFRNVASVETPDAKTAVVKLAQPFGPFLSFLTADNVGILPAHVYAGSDPLKNPANQKPIGTGPFKFQSWTPGQSINLVRNDEYWDAGKPYLDRLVFSIIPDANARVLALESGQIDLITNYDIAVNDIARLKKTPGISVFQKGPVPRPLLLIFNNKAKPLDNPKVRQALFRGLDRQLIKENAYAGEGDVGRSAIPPGLAWAHNPAVDYMKSYGFDAKKANQDLDEAGLPRGANNQRFAIRYIYDPAQAGFAEIGEIMRNNWRDLGVQVTLEARERNVWLDAVYAKKDFNVTVAFYLAGVDPAVGVDRAYLCSEVRAANFTNASQYCNPELDTLFNAARTTLDREARAKAYREAQVIIERDLPTAVLMDSPFAHAISSKFGGIEAMFQYSNETNVRFAEAFVKGK